jgi:solute carrier family 25 (mitochondrial iron transporter), member 28/37
MFKAHGHEHHPVGAACTGAIAAISHDLIMTPFDVIKQRMQLGYYQHIGQCLQEMIRQEGIRAFYVSLPATLFMNIPYGAVVIMVNESMRKILSSSQSISSSLSASNSQEKLTVSASLTAGCIAGAIAAAVTTPLDVIKTRLQTQELAPCTEQQLTGSVVSTTNSNSNRNSTSNNNSKILPSQRLHYNGCIEKASPISQTILSSTHRLNTMDIIQRIWRQEGMPGFFRGIFPRMISQAPAVAISWTVYEVLKNTLNSISTTN